MDRQAIIAAIDEEISRLETVRSLLRDTRNLAPGVAKALGAKSKTKRRMSAEGRRRIVEAQRRRWAKQKQGASKAKKQS
ncbi:MAG: hypothetical protein ACR2JE_05910 [Acidobacteriaceae bacterium]